MEQCANTEKAVCVQHGADTEKTVCVQHGADTEKAVCVQLGADTEKAVCVQHGADKEKTVNQLDTNEKSNSSYISKETKDKIINQSEYLPKAPLWMSARLSLALCGCYAYIVLYSLKAYIGLAIVCMVNNSAMARSSANVTWPSANSTDLDICLPADGQNVTAKDGELLWTASSKGLVLSAFFWGYVLTQVPGGWLSEYWGGKRVVAWCLCVAVLASFFIPLAAHVSHFAVVTLRVVQGLGAGVVPAASSSLWAKWAPPGERSWLFGFTHAGGQIGAIITYPISGLLCDSDFAGGWPSIFYVFGMVGVVWLVLWMVFVSDSPRQHPRITCAERRYIEHSLGNTHQLVLLRKSLGTPWQQFFKSKAVWANHVGFAVSEWGRYLILTHLPTYMHDVLHVDITENGLLSALPFFAYWVMINVSSFVADKILAKGARTATVRKVFFTISCLGPAVFLVGAGYVPCGKPYVAVAMVTVAVGMCGFHYAGLYINYIDIAPPFAGVLFGMSNTFGALAGVVAPYVVQLITASGTVDSWRTVFIITAAIYASGAIMFDLLAEGEVQSWARPYMHNTLPLLDKVSSLQDNDINSSLDSGGPIKSVVSDTDNKAQLLNEGDVLLSTATADYRR